MRNAHLFFDGHVSADSPAFDTTVENCNGSMGEAVILVSFLQDKSASTKDFFEGVQATLKKTDAKVKMEKVRCFLGDGRAYLLETGGGEKRQRLRSELYPVKSGVWLLYKLVADPRHFSIAEKEFIKARSTLANLK